MRIGIITYHNALNTGAVLQAYALQTYLTGLGNHVELIDYRMPLKINLKTFFSKSISKTIWKWKDFIWFMYYSKLDKFSGELLHVGNKSYYSLEGLQKDPPLMDLYIAGSDQIWNVGSNFKFFAPYFLNFGNEKIRRISFAASFGQCNIPNNLNGTIKEQLLRFDAISVREANGVDYVNSLLEGKKEVHHIADPTFLLNKTDYLRISSTKLKYREKPYIASYILSDYEEEQYQIIEYLKSRTKLNLINLRNPNTCIRLPKATNIVVKPMQWLSYIYYSNCVVCSSFHAVVFSLIFHKRFIVVSPNENRRILSLLNLVGLPERILCKFEKKQLEKLLETEIDWPLIDEKLNDLQKEGFRFLNKSLS